jgi:molybdopterin converting factor small subunit
VARVVLMGGLSRALTHGATEFDVEATTVRGVIRELEKRFPGLGQQIENEMAVAIDGEMHQEPFLQPVKPGSEVCFLPKLRGG